MCDKFIAAVDRECEGLESVSPGLCGICPVCQSECGEDAFTTAEFSAKIASGEICDEGGFSWHSCDSCGSSLGGDRHVAHAWSDEAREKGFPIDELIHMEICVDCVMLHANGDVPETWEG